MVKSLRYTVCLNTPRLLQTQRAYCIHLLNIVIHVFGP